MKIKCTPKQVLQYIILGINNGNYQAVKDLAQDAIDQIDQREKEEENEETQQGEDQKTDRSGGNGRTSKINQPAEETVQVPENQTKDTNKV